LLLGRVLSLRRAACDVLARVDWSGWFAVARVLDRAYP
jgi:hypothetical protein